MIICIYFCLKLESKCFNPFAWTKVPLSLWRLFYNRHPSKGRLSCQLHCNWSAFLRFRVSFGLRPSSPPAMPRPPLDNAHSWRHLSNFRHYPAEKTWPWPNIVPVVGPTHSTPSIHRPTRTSGGSSQSLWLILTFLICAPLRWPLKCRVTSLVCVCGAICIWPSKYLCICVSLCSCILNIRAAPVAACVFVLRSRSVRFLGVFCFWFMLRYQHWACSQTGSFIFDDDIADIGRAIKLPAPVY